MSPKRTKTKTDPDTPKRIRYRVIAEGGDGIEEWSGDFEILEKVFDIRMDAEEQGRDIDWREVLSGAEGVSLDPNHRISIDDEVDLLRLVDGVEIESEAWGGDTPGLSGHWVRVRVRSDRYRQVVKTVRTLVGRLEDAWERTGGREQSVAAAAEAAAKHMQAVLDAGDELERLDLAKMQAELSRAEALTQWCRRVLHEPGLQPRAFEWILIAQNRVFFLEESISGKPVSDDNLSREAVEQLQRECTPVVRVREALPAHRGRPSWMAGIVYVPQGWKQTQTFLTAETEAATALATEARAKYVALERERERAARETSK